MNKKLLFSLVMMLFAMATPAMAESLTVYEGELGNAYVPIYGFYADAYLKCEYVIPAADLQVMDGKVITNITWYTNTPADGSCGNAKFQVFLMEVDNATIDAFQGPGQIVYEGPLDGTGETINIEFEEPYEYDGGNLLVGVYNTVTGSYKSVSFKGQEVAGAAVQGYSYNSLDAVSPTQRNFIPQTTFEYVSEYIGKPKNVVASDITANSAVISWEGQTENYNLRYRTTAVMNGVTEDFMGYETGDVPEGWTLIDADGDGENWYIWNLTLDDGTTQVTFSSNSYINYQGPLTPDNWAITPQSKLGAQVKFDAWGQDPGYAAEHFQVYVSTTGTAQADFEAISDELVATGEQTTYTFNVPADLVGQMGYIAIRHFNCTDQYILNVTNFYMAGEGEDIPEGEWIVLENINNPYTLQGLKPLTEYEVQVQSVYETREVTDWSKSGFFTTLEGEAGIEELYMVGSFNGWNQTEEGGRIAFEFVDGEFIANVDLEDGAEFKLITPLANPTEEAQWQWFGGQDDNQVGYFLITDELLSEGIVLIDGANFRIENGGSYTISVFEAPRGLNEPLVMTVTKSLPTAITDINSNNSDNTWYNIHGMKIQGTPTVPGIYITTGRKVVVK